LIAAGDEVLARVRYSGTHLGRYRGVPPTGRAISVTGLELFLIGDGRIVHHWHETDHLGILEQIGCAVALPG
jgi:predicted ester cyclase